METRRSDCEEGHDEDSGGARPDEVGAVEILLMCGGSAGGFRGWFSLLGTPDQHSGLEPSNEDGEER